MTMSLSPANRYTQGEGPSNSSSKSLDNLPNELLGWICGYCEIPEIKALRLACRATNHVANDHLFPEVVMFMSRDSLEACRGIATHPVFSKTARSLWIQADRPPTMTLKEWTFDHKPLDLEIVNEASKMIDREYAIGSRDHTFAMKEIMREARIHSNEKRSAFSEKQCQFFHSHAVRIATDAEQMMYDQSLAACLLEVLANCDKVDAVDLTMDDHIRKTTTEDHKGFMPGLLRPAGDLDRLCSGHNAMEQLVLAASQTGFKPRKLNLGNLSHTILVTQDEFTEKLLDFFANVEHLAWEFSVPALLSGGEYILHEDAYMDVAIELSQTRALASLMDATKKLQHLRLELPSRPDGWPSASLPSANLPDIVGHTTWKDLTHLNIANFEAEPDDLTDLLIRHGDILTYVQFGTVYLKTGTWPECFMTFAGKLPKIQQFEVRGRFSDNHIDESFLWFGRPNANHNNARGEEVCKFIISVGEAFPAVQYQHDEDESTSEHRGEGNDEDGNDGLEGDEDDDEA